MSIQGNPLEEMQHNIQTIVLILLVYGSLSQTWPSGNTALHVLDASLPDHTSFKQTGH